MDNPFTVSPLKILPFTVIERKRSLWGENLQEKSWLRQEIRKKRNQIHPRVSAYKCSIIQQTLKSLPEFQSAQTIACYNAYQSEVDLTRFMQDCLKTQKRVVLPKVCGKDLCFYEVTDLTEQQNIGAFHIVEPDETKCALVHPDEIDLFLVPGIAFDLFGFRVGYGGGYYDRYLHNKRLDAISIGVGYDMQLVHAIHNEEHDVPVDLVVTDAMNDGNIIDPMHSLHSTQSPEETQEIANQLVCNGLTREPLIALHGDLGTGKTEFVKGMAQACEVEHSVCSPTYVFIHEYQGKQSLRHIDCYRIGELKEQDNEFWDEAITSINGCVVIEWAEKIAALLRNDTVHIAGERTGERARIWSLYTFYRNQKHLHQVKLC